MLAGAAPLMLAEAAPLFQSHPLDLAQNAAIRILFSMW